MQSEVEQRYMRRALALARKGGAAVRPNPMVGALIINGGRIVGSGWHQKAGGPHAEIAALSAAGAKARGGEMFVTLEPCTHHGRTGPCTDAILKAGIKRVVIACRDPNPKVSGGGAERLREDGVEVSGPILEREAKELNAGWLHWLKTGRPLIYGIAARNLTGAFSDAAWSSQLDRRRPFFHSFVRGKDFVAGNQTIRCENTTELLQTIHSSGAEGIQNVLIEEMKTVFELLAANALDRLAIVHTVSDSKDAVSTNSIDAALQLLRVRRVGAEALSVYQVTGR